MHSISTKSAVCDACDIDMELDVWNRRTPGPATAVILEMCRQWTESVDAPRYLKPETRNAMMAFIAEHKPA